MANKTLVTGDVKLPAGTDHFDNATLIVKLEDVSMMGGASSEIAKTVVRTAYKGRSIPFKLSGAIPGDNDSRSRYNVRVHISFHGDDNNIQKGDFISTQSYPVLNGNPSKVSVSVKKV